MTDKNPRPKPVHSITPAPVRDDAAHKGQVGRVFVIAGSRGMSGAACLAGAGALRSGAGLVRVLTPASVQHIVATSDPCLMTVPAPETKAGLIDWKKSRALLEESFEWASAAAIGPGLGQDDDLGDLVRFTCDRFAGPLIVDADGLNNIAPDGPDVWTVRDGRPTIITPHPGEIARLRRSAKLKKLHGADDDIRTQIAHEYAARTGVTTVLKGRRTVVATTESVYINTTGNPGMATGGMGDVLTGVIASLIGQGLDAFDAACLGVYCHGLSADMCRKRIGPVGYLARDVAEILPAALAQTSTARMGFKP